MLTQCKQARVYQKHKLCGSTHQTLKTTYVCFVWVAFDPVEPVWPQFFPDFPTAKASVWAVMGRVSCLSDSGHRIRRVRNGACEKETIRDNMGVYIVTGPVWGQHGDMFACHHVTYQVESKHPKCHAFSHVELSDDTISKSRLGRVFSHGMCRRGSNMDRTTS